MRTGLVGTVAAAAIALSAAMVSAETVELKRTNPDDTFDGVAPIAATVSSPEGTLSANIGAFRVTDGINNFLAWCASLADTLKLPAQYTATELPFANRGILGTEVRTNIQTLFDQSYTLALTENSVDSAAFQLALWNVMYDDMMTVDDGAFRYLGGDATVRNRANAFLASLELGPDQSVEQQWILTFWEAEDKAGKPGVPASQNLITAAPIPLPAAAWMLLGALAAVAGVSRVRRRTA